MENGLKNFFIKIGMEMKNEKLQFTENEEVNCFLNNIKDFPHAYILGCFMNRQCPAERVWSIPYEIKEELGDFSMKTLVSTSLQDYTEIFNNRNLHRYNNTMARVFYKAIQRIHHEYKDDVSMIWKGKPSSRDVVNKLLEFYGVGIKISTMTANILVRQFEVELSDYRSIDVSPDALVRRVMERMGLIEKRAPKNQIISIGREINPEYPGIIDYPLWNVGKEYCPSVGIPNCEECYLKEYCEFYRTR